jgi:hypothetical protein
MVLLELFNSEGADGVSPSFRPRGGSIETANRKSYLELNGTLGNASIILEIKDPSASWHTTGRSDEIKLITDFPGVFIIDYSDEIELRVRISGAGGGTNLSIWAKNVDQVEEE